MAVSGACMMSLLIPSAPVCKRYHQYSTWRQTLSRCLLSFGLRRGWLFTKVVNDSTTGNCVASVYCYVSRIPESVLPPKSDDMEQNTKSEWYEVRVIDNDHNTYDEVIRICSLALEISAAEAYRIAWEVDHLGSCAAAHSSLDEATRIAEIIRSIGIDVKVTQL